MVSSSKHWFLLSYHRRQRMIPETLQRRVEGGRVSHNWYMSVVSHGYGGKCGRGVEVVCGMHAGHGQDWLVTCLAIAEHIPSMQGSAMYTRSHRLPGTQLLVGSVFRERSQHGTPQNGSGSLSRQPVGYTPWCSTDVRVVGAVRVSEIRKALFTTLRSYMQFV